MKKEFIHLHPVDTVERLRIGVFEYIEVYCNRLRIHSTIDYLTPVEFEEEFDKKGDRAAR
ncbi:IS3 family transposase [Frankia sp. Cas3]|uniref:IS3 family transposase n=1 Tax=Frankia sp. Cas3 TaxID=3073926 RepID=UPI002AD2CAD5|nr:IS3 family transposase [Frankia sp. Cas3]